MLAVYDESNIAASRPLSEWGSGRANNGFLELRPTLFIGPQAAGWSLYIDDEPLPATAKSSKSAWEWNPGFYAGAVVAELVAPDGLVAGKYLLDVSPDPAKVGQGLFNQLVEDIQQFAPSLLFGSEPATTTVGADSSSEDKNVQCSRLLHYGPSLLTALRAIRERPHKVLQPIRTLKPASQAKAIDAHTVRGMLRNPAALALLEDRGDSRPGLEIEPPLLDVPSVRESFDSAANRCMVALLRAVVRRALYLKEFFAASVILEDTSDTRTLLAARWPRRAERIDAIVKGIHRSLSKEPLRSASRAEVDAAGLTAIAAHPLYSRVHGLIWRILRPGLAGRSADEHTWMSPTWEIFERWCFVHLCGALKAIHPEADWKLTGVTSGNFRYRANTPSGLVSLYLQPTFRHSDTPSTETGFWSISGYFVPDLALVIEGDGATRWAVFDAKYRQKRSSILDAMRSAHVYHDALRRFQAPPHRSLLLVPAPSPEADWLTSASFKKEHGVGVVVLARDSCATQKLLIDIIQS